MSTASTWLVGNPTAGSADPSTSIGADATGEVDRKPTGSIQTDNLLNTI